MDSFILKISSIDNESVSHFKSILKVGAIFGMNFVFLFLINFRNYEPTNVPVVYRNTSYLAELFCHVKKFLAAVKL
jgi:hypothetical protein